MPAKTPLFAEHERLGATITDFHGWLLPVYYSMPIAEHNAVRERCGLFDVSHMGALLVEGKDAQRLIQRIVVRDISKMCAGEIKLGAICNEKGGIVDDLTIYKFAEEKFWLVVNAGPYDTDLRIAKENAAGLSVSVEGLRAKNAKIDIQGPKAALALQKIAAEPLGDLKYYNFKEMKVGGAPCVVSRSGYTGEDGFEIYFGAKHAQKLWRALLEAGKEFGIAPCGLGARDTLRL
ncbi:MAG: glycine cleavage system aminomethyltransferase GcvT, partial [Candidatus Diapherotrites archaeon]|nr:glycine cleavage system aminomethyltransferase GcvT [Candidatus Diapherotrites archaeon]